MSLFDLESRSRSEKYTVICRAYFNGHVYERRGTWYLKYWDAFPEWTGDEDLFTRDLYEWADRINGELKEGEAGGTIMVCSRCKGVHEWLERCPPAVLEPLDNNF